MKAKTLRVRAAGDTRVVDLEAMRAGARRFVGREWSDEAQDFVPSGDVTIPDRSEYRLALRDGDLISADDAAIARKAVAVVKKEVV